LLSEADGTILPTMIPLPGHRLRALLLALVLALGVNVSLVQGGLMAAEMAVSADAAQPCPHGCDGCGDGHGGLDAGTCLSLCGAAAQGLLPGEPIAHPPASRASLQARYLVFGGRFHSPDPGPPKPSP
jgi:hypothetical protein